MQREDDLMDTNLILSIDWLIDRLVCLCVGINFLSLFSFKIG